jgi:hypothetical protein
MMGKQTSDQERLFYGFNLESHVPQDHLLRGINYFLDLSDLREYLSNYYSPTGRPSIDPELMIRMLVIGYCFGIRSERRLCEEVHLTWPIAGSVGSVWKIRCPITRRSQRTGMVDFARAAPSGNCSRAYCVVA